MEIKAKKSLGQNFLIDRNILEQIVDTVDIFDYYSGKKSVPSTTKQAMDAVWNNSWHDS